MTAIPSSHLTWLKETNQPGAPSFFETFGYNREEGRRHYLRLISWSTLAKSKRQELGDEFRQWEANDADQYWLLRQSKSTKTRVATAAIKESESVSVAALQNSSGSKSRGKDVIDTAALTRSIITTTTSTTIDFTSTSKVTNAQASGHKHPRDSLGKEDEASKKTVRNAERVHMSSPIYPLTSFAHHCNPRPLPSLLVQSDLSCFQKIRMKSRTSQPQQAIAKEITLTPFSLLQLSISIVNIFCKNFVMEGNSLVTVTVRNIPSISCSVGQIGGLK
ncbi:MAG: hypothetical protein J3R72DRAFT_181783 [Linnemannia gamsii]|nr:MAG: hypothetical protein J3R72DRAFT_181783 [Linnemannia gamsii]